eukprot:1377614-Amorphochlora_amoeboformis.AAC.2
MFRPKPPLAFFSSTSVRLTYHYPLLLSLGGDPQGFNSDQGSPGIRWESHIAYLFDPDGTGSGCRGIEASDNLIKLIVRKWTKVVHPVLERTMKGEDWEKVLIEEYKKLDVDKNGFIDGNEILPALERTHELVGELLELPG